MIAIESATASDLPDVVALLERCGLPPQGLADHLGTLLVARHEGQLVASAALELYGEAALLRSVAVAQACRRRGLGRALVEAVLAVAGARGVGTVYLLTLTAAEFFARLGFERIPRAEVPAIVQGSLEFTTLCPASAIVMRRAVATRPGGAAWSPGFPPLPTAGSTL